mmetsp:Transcript_82420/g.163521  ORF Transcript_82420/g.163521 Transcript_82420/m.163521 type:complete len:340 (-) Transcript_82420:30-1049(-)
MLTQFVLSVAVLLPHAWASRITAEKTEENGKRLNIRVEVLFVRHGHACHNALHYHSKKKAGVKIGKLKHFFYADPPLTNCGLLNSFENGRELRAALGNWTPQFVGTSSMVRAIETAIAMFPGHEVVPLPFIREDALGACNTPTSLEKQKELLSIARINWQHMETDVQLEDDRVDVFNHKKKYSATDARESIKYREFRAFLGEKIVPSLLPAELVPGQVLKLAIVSHSGFLKARLKKYFKCDVYFTNNEARLVTYSYDSKSHLLSEHNSDIPSFNCKDPLGGTPGRKWGKEKKYACAQDYSRCMAVDAKAMGNAKGSAGDPSPWIQAPAEGEECCIGPEI